MILLGLTGSIGMGKSTTATLFQDLGVPVYDADAAVHALYAKGGAGVAAVEQAFPGTTVNGEVDRERLREAVLGHPDAMDKLNNVVHPLLRQHRAEFLGRAKADGADVAVLDVPLLYETGGERGVDKVVVVSAPAEVQRERVLARPGMNPQRLAAILSRQMPDEEKRLLADYIVETGDGLEAARARVAQIVAEVRAAKG